MRPWAIGLVPAIAGEMSRFEGGEVAAGFGESFPSRGSEVSDG